MRIQPLEGNIDRLNGVWEVVKDSANRSVVSHAWLSDEIVSKAICTGKNESFNQATKTIQSTNKNPQHVCIWLTLFQLCERHQQGIHWMRGTMASRADIPLALNDIRCLEIENAKLSNRKLVADLTKSLFIVKQSHHKQKIGPKSLSFLLPLLL